MTVGWPFVSVLISTKDRRDDLARALESIAAQDYPRERVEVVVVEETDQAAPPVGVRYIAIPREGRGFGYTRAVALAHASGEIVAFTDDDCVATPSWLRELVRPLLQDPTVLGVAGAVFVSRANAIGVCESILGFPGGGVRYHAAAAGRVVPTDHLSTCNCAYRRDVLERVGGFPAVAPWSGEDYIVGRRVRRMGSCVYAPAAIVYHKPRGTLAADFRWFVRRGRQEVWLRRNYPDVFELSTGHLVRTSLVLRLGVALGVARLVGLSTLPTVVALALLYAAVQNLRYRFGWRYYRVPWILAVLPLTKLAMGFGGEAGRWLEMVAGYRAAALRRREVHTR